MDELNDEPNMQGVHYFEGGFRASTHQTRVPEERVSRDKVSECQL